LNSYGETTTVTAGTLTFHNASGLGSSTGTITVADGGTLQAAGSFTMTRPLVLNGLGFRGLQQGFGALAGVKNLGAPPNVTWAGPISLASTAAVSGVLITGSIDGPGGFTVFNDTTLAGTAPITYQGVTTVNGGGLTLNKPAHTNAIPGDLLIATAIL